MKHQKRYHPQDIRGCWEQCRNCNGTGMINQSRCNSCNGSGMGKCVTESSAPQQDKGEK